MLDFWSLAVLVVLWVLVAPLVGLVVAGRARERAAEAIRRVAALEEQLARRLDPLPAGTEATPEFSPDSAPVTP